MNIAIRRISNDLTRVRPCSLIVDGQRTKSLCFAMLTQLYLVSYIIFFFLTPGWQVYFLV